MMQVASSVFTFPLAIGQPELPEAEGFPSQQRQDTTFCLLLPLPSSAPLFGLCLAPFLTLPIQITLPFPSFFHSATASRSNAWFQAGHEAQHMGGRTQLAWAHVAVALGAALETSPSPSRAHFPAQLKQQPPKPGGSARRVPVLLAPHKGHLLSAQISRSHSNASPPLLAPSMRRGNA